MNIVKGINYVKIQRKTSVVTVLKIW